MRSWPRCSRLSHTEGTRSTAVSRSVPERTRHPSRAQRHTWPKEKMGKSRVGLVGMPQKKEVEQVLLHRHATPYQCFCTLHSASMTSQHPCGTIPGGTAERGDKEQLKVSRGVNLGHFFAWRASGFLRSLLSLVVFFGSSAAVWWLIFPPVTRKTRAQFPAELLWQRQGTDGRKGIAFHRVTGARFCSLEPCTAAREPKMQGARGSSSDEGDAQRCLQNKW